MRRQRRNSGRYDAVEEGGDEVGVDGVGDGNSHLVDEQNQNHRTTEEQPFFKSMNVMFRLNKALDPNLTS